MDKQILRCEDGTIVHTGDFKIDEHPLDGQHFNRTMFEAVGKEGADLLLSDSTNVLAAGRTMSERDVAENIMRKVQAHHDNNGVSRRGCK